MKFMQETLVKEENTTIKVYKNTTSRANDKKDMRMRITFFFILILRVRDGANVSFALSCIF